MKSVTRGRKTLQQLTFKDNFMFAAVMMDEENAKGVLQRALDMEIDRVEVSYEKSIVYHPEYKGIRLDVYIKDSNHTHFNVEMQVVNKKILKRARYYHSQLDMELLESGVDYEELPKAYVIFICDFDPIGLGKYKYTRCQRILEDESYEYDDESYTVFLSTVGQNDDEVSEDLVNFLKYAGADLTDSQEDYSDEFVIRLQKSVEKIKYDREMGRRYMLMEEIRKEEFKAGKAEGKAEGLANAIIDFLSDIADTPENLKQRILSIQSPDELAVLTKKAARVKTIEEFEQELDAMKL